MTIQTIDWANRWIGGFCALAAVGGLPIRGADYAAHPPLAQAQVLPPVVPISSADVQEATEAWASALGAPVVLVRSVERARALVLAAAELAAGSPVVLPANATRPLVEAVKRHGTRPLFRDLGEGLGIFPLPPKYADAPCWAQPVGGLVVPDSACWLDCADTLPDVEGTREWPEVALFGLHLAQDAAQSGALLVFGNPDLAQRVATHLQPDDQPDMGRALAQLQRLLGTPLDAGLAARQRDVLAETRRGLWDAAGLELLTGTEQALAHHIAVRIPHESDVATFYAYVQAEQTPVQWVPEVRPLHYAAVREPGRASVSAAHLARWLLVPVGPEYTTEEVSHAVLGIVKAAEYLGVRWRAQPQRASEYAAMLDELYGPNHDAYRVLF